MLGENDEAALSGSDLGGLLADLTWADCQAVGKEVVALRIKGKGSVFHDVPVTGALSAALLGWKDIQEGFKPRRITAPDGIAFAGSQFVFAGYSGAPFSNRREYSRMFGAPPLRNIKNLTEANNQDQAFSPTTED